MKIVFLALFLILSIIPSQAQTPNREEATRLNNQAVALAKEHQYEKALVVIDRALLFDPRDEVENSNKVSFLMSLTRYDEAMAVVEGALRDHPNSPDLKSQRSILLNFTEQYAESRREYFQSLLERDTQPLPYGLRELSGVFSIPDGTVEPRAGEIRLDGFYLGTENGLLVFDAYAFFLPNGRGKVIEPKRRSIALKGIEPEYGDIGSIPLSQLRMGDFIVVLGRESQGHFTTRRVLVAKRSETEEKKRGALFDGTALKWIEDQDYPEGSDDASGIYTFDLPNEKKLVANIANLVRDGDETALLATATSFSPFGGEQTPDKASWQSPLQKATELAVQLKSVREVSSTPSYGKPSPLTHPTPIHVTMGKPFPGGEIIATPVTNQKVAWPLATSPPQRGDVVYFQGWYDSSIWWREAVVLYNDANRLFLLVDKEGEEARIPGSAIVNKKGELVGMHVGGTDPYISGVSVDAIRRTMRQMRDLK